jgi:hypothetical protein
VDTPAHLLLSLEWLLLLRLRLRQLLGGIAGAGRAALVASGDWGGSQHAQRVQQQGLHLVAIRRQRLRDDARHNVSTSLHNRRFCTSSRV